MRPIGCLTALLISQSRVKLSLSSGLFLLKESCQKCNLVCLIPTSFLVFIACALLHPLSTLIPPKALVSMLDSVGLSLKGSK